MSKLLLTTLVGALLALSACSKKPRLVLEPGGYVQDALARSTGIESDDLLPGSMGFDEVDLHILIDARRVLTLPSVGVSGTILGEQIAEFSIPFSSAEPTPEASYTQLSKVSSLLAEVGITPRQPLPSSPEELSELRDGSVALYFAFDEPKHAAYSVQVSSGWYVGRKESVAFAQLRFVAKEFSPIRPK